MSLRASRSVRGPHDLLIVEFCSTVKSVQTFAEILSSPELGSSIGTVVPAQVAVVITPATTMKNAVENTVVSLDGS